MKITIVRTGGIAGMRAQLGRVETEQLGEAGSRIAAKVEEIGFFDLPAELPKDNRIDDAYYYEMTIEDGDRRHAVGYGDNTERRARKPLFDLQYLLIASGVDFEGDAPIRGLAGGDGFSWIAWRNRMPGIDDPDLHVVGTCQFGSSSVELSLEPGNEGVVDDPELFVLQLTISEPAGGDEMMSEEYAIWTGDVGPDVKRVRVQGGAQAEFEVIDAV
jgi:hypothetical protein